MDRILFLDDMEWRHSEFRKRAASRPNVEVKHVYTAKAAIRLLKTEHFDQVFLDHDLSEDDIMVRVDAESKVPTGMDVVNYILTMDDPPKDIIIHSCNGPAACEMLLRLEKHQAKMRVRKIAFPHLIHALDIATFLMAQPKT